MAKKLRTKKAKRAASKFRKKQAWWQLSQKQYLWLLGLLALTSVVYAPALDNQFTNWDDQYYVSQNAWLRNLSAENLEHIFTDQLMGNYHPITVLSFAFDYQMGGEKPFIYHFTNLLFHLLNTILVFFFFYLLSKRNFWTAFITALLFALHPMHVESVAWVSERKDVLYTFFFFISLIAYYQYVSTKKAKLYLLTLVAFFLSAFSKPAAVVFPIVLLLVDYFLQRKWDKVALLEKIPFFLISLVVGLLTIKSQDEAAAIGMTGDFGIFNKALFAAYGFVMYIVKLLVPYGLTAYYPYPDVADSLPILFYIFPFVMLGILYLAYHFREKNRLLTFAILFYFVNVALVLQFISVGRVIMSERYTYVPYLGLFFLLAYLYNQLIISKLSSKLKKMLPIILLLVTLAFSYISHERTKVWYNSETLWTSVIETQPQVAMAYYDRGSFYSDHKKFDAAIADYTQAIKYDSTYYEATYNRGLMLKKQHKYTEALRDFTKAIQIEGTHPEAFTNKANTFIAMQQNDSALYYYHQALQVDSTYYLAYFNRSVCYFNIKNYEKALTDCNACLRYKPIYHDASFNRGNIYMRLQNYDAAIPDFLEVLRQNPKNDQAYFNLAFVYFQKKDLAQAVHYFSETIRVNPQNANAYMNRAVIYDRTQQYKKAYQDVLKNKQLGGKVTDTYIQQLKAKAGF